MTLVEYFAGGILAVAFVITAGAHLPGDVSGWLRRRDYLNLIPDFRFFAPNPGTFDYVLVYRDRADDGSIGLWQAVESDRAGWTRFLWNPRRRLAKALVDICQDFVFEQRARPGDDPRRFLSYAGLVWTVAHLARIQSAAATQFAITRVDGTEVAVTFVSDFHPLDRR